MNTIRRNGLLLVATFVLLASLTACSTNPAPVATSGSLSGSLTQDQVSSIVENMLTGYNTADYAAFSRDLSDAMKLVVSEELFQQFVAESAATLGQFRSITSIEQGESNETSTSWVITAEFEKSTQQFTVTFDRATGQIEGMDFGPAG